MTISLQELKDQILSGTREVDVVHNSKSDGSGSTVVSKMVYVPKFRVPAGLWDGGAFPTVDLKLGGFLIDKYQASQPDATNTSRGSTTPNTPGVVAAVSQQGVVPWTDISQTNALVAASNRKINGRACHLVTMKEWATVCFLIKLLGHDIRGNNSWGRDYRDPDSFEYYGIEDILTDSYAAGYGHGTARLLTGTGPVSWSHNGMANGVFDIVGNVWEWLDFLIDAGVYKHIKKAKLNDADGITTVDAAIVIDNIEDIANWPAADGLIMIKAEGVNTDEYVRYATITNNGDGTATLNNCQRGQNGTAASAHADNADIEQITDYCIIPGGYSAKLSDAGLNNTNDPATFNYSDLILGPGGANPVVGDVLQCQNEQLTITAVNGTSVTVSRGSNGSTIAAHAQDTGITKLSPQMTNLTPEAIGDYGAYQFGKFVTMRTVTELQPLALPLVVSADGNEEWKDGFWLRSYGQRAALRGGCWNSGSAARSGFALYLYNLPSHASIYIGFRAALSL